MNLNTRRELDWLQLSRFTGGTRESIINLDGLLHERVVSEEMFERLPMGYIARLLRAIRNELLNFEESEHDIEQAIAIRVQQRNRMLQDAHRFEVKLADSKSKLSTEHDQLKVKNEVLKKLMSKIARRQKVLQLKQQERKKEPSTHYYCPFCRSDEFVDRSAFERHMLEMHNPSTQDSQVQNFILELKDKEIALMELVMKKNEDMNEAARTLLDRELHSRTHDFRKTFAATVGETYTDKIAPFDDQLLCESEFVAFRNENVSQENLPKYYDVSAQKEKIHENIMQRHMDLQSRHIHPGMQSLKAGTGFISKRNPTANHQNGWTIKQEEVEPLKTQPLRLEQPTPLSIRGYDTPNPSYRILNYDTNSSKKPIGNNPSSSIYHTNNLSVEGYAYCSGPLQDDDSDSEVGDYFFRRASQKLIVDEDIVLDEKLLSKWGSSIMQHEQQPEAAVSASKVRLPSDLLSAEDSIEDKDFSLSKDSSDINLSQLRYSKLLKAKQSKTPEKRQPIEKAPQVELFPIIEKDEPNTARQSGILNNFLPNSVGQILEGTANFNPISFRKRSPERNSRLLQEFLSHGDTERPRRSSSKTEKPLAETAAYNPPAKKKSCRRTQQSSPVQRQKSKIEPQQPYVTMPSESYNPEHHPSTEDPTERFILKQLDDLTLIKQDEGEQTISAEVHPLD